MKSFNSVGEIYERVKEFKYYGAQSNYQTEMHLKIRARIAAQKLITSSDLNKKLKILVYRFIIRPTVLYGSDTRTQRKSDEELLGVWVRKIFADVWRIRTNKEIYDCYKESDIFIEIKRRRIQRLGHVERMEPSRTAKRPLKERPIASKPRVRPKIRWLDQVEEDLKRLSITN